MRGALKVPRNHFREHQKAKFRHDTALLKKFYRLHIKYMRHTKIFLTPNLV